MSAVTLPNGATARSRRPNRIQRHRRRFLVAMVVPAVAFALLICVVPLLSALGLSFFDYDLTKPAPMSWAGVDNYVDFFSSNLGRASIINTLVFAVGGTVSEFALAFALALLLWRDTSFNKVVAALLLVPVAFTPLVAGLMFRSLYSTSYGPIGYWVKEALGGNIDSIISNPATAMPALILVDIWQWTPLVALTLLAGLRSLPDEVTEAAQLDGAGYWTRFLHMVLPQMAPYIFIALIIRTMDAFKVFDSIFVITGGGPGDATTTLNYLAFTEGLRFFNVGYASAISNILLFIISAFALIYIVTLHRVSAKFEGE